MSQDRDRDRERERSKDGKTKVYVGKVSSKVKSSDLEAMFGKVGKIVNFNMTREAGTIFFYFLFFFLYKFNT